MRTLKHSSFLAVVATAVTLLAACAQEVSHTESDKPGWFGGRTHSEDTTYKNPDGTISHQHEQTTIKP